MLSPVSRKRPDSCSRSCRVPSTPQVAGKQLPAPMPFFFISDACASSAKPYAESYEYIPEVEFVLSQARGVRCVWVGAGVFHRGQWPGYAEVVSALLTDNPNLYVSFTPELIAGELALPADWALDMASAHPDRVVLGTSIRGNFTASPPPAFGGQSYAEQCSTLSTFLERVEAAVTAKSQQPTESARAAEGACAKARIRFGNAAVVYNLMSEAEASMLGKASEASSVADGVSSKDEAAGPLTDVSEAKTESGEAPENERRSMCAACVPTAPHRWPSASLPNLGGVTARCHHAGRVGPSQVYGTPFVDSQECPGAALGRTAQQRARGRGEQADMRLAFCRPTLWLASLPRQPPSPASLAGCESVVAGPCPHMPKAALD